MQRRILGWVTVALVGLAACSGTPRLAPAYDRSPDVLSPPEPEIFASGTIMGGEKKDTPIQWDLEEIIGFEHAVSLTAATPTTISVRSASRQGAGDAVWLVGTTLMTDGPAMVFGGADGEIDSIVLVNTEGEELGLELIQLPEQDWSLAIEELPAGWSMASGESVVVVARSDGTEIAREDLIGLNS